MLKDRVEQRREPLAREGGLSLNKLFAAPPPEFLVTPLLIWPTCLIIQG